MTDSVTSIFLATDCTAVEFDRHGPEEDHMDLLHLPLADAIAMVLNGEIADAKTVVALLLTERQLAARRLSATDAERRAPARGRGVPLVDGRREGRSENTLSAYRRDLTAYVTWLSANGHTIEDVPAHRPRQVRGRTAGERCGDVVDRTPAGGDPHAPPLPGAGRRRAPTTPPPNSKGCGCRRGSPSR